jgi:hypothetical protein
MTFSVETDSLSPTPEPLSPQARAVLEAAEALEKVWAGATVSFGSLPVAEKLDAIDAVMKSIRAYRASLQPEACKPEEVERLAEAMAEANSWGHSSSCATSEFVEENGPCNCGALAMWRRAAEVAIRVLSPANPDGDVAALREAKAHWPPATPAEVERLRDGLESAANALDAVAAWVRERFCLDDAAEDIERDAKQAWYVLETAALAAVRAKFPLDKEQ